ncbi:phosphatase PAP2 family protein [Anaeromyxobacter diazotrophicus]|uniref:Aureobasidin A resistance protein n=1 Tax=Anaeromyxobacter diazotrophicus TaxID=2590199 RepID=A0A7I9VSB9_9BACT|nr:phosphatase PAP2 family protein [Anaeromyxobacter diazotrophicus]GEJ59201.1 aureobasidin A resistance protein [Anaeromyxobacter diazotrophicus]
MEPQPTANEAVVPQRRSPTLAQRVRDTPPGVLYGALGGMGAYLVAMRLFQGVSRPEQLALCTAMLGLVVWSDATRRFFIGMLPFLLFGIVYDLTHITQPLFRYLHIHIAEPYAFDRALFGIREGGAVLTPNEFFARHHWPVVDLFTGTAYIVFVYWAIGFAAYLAIFRRDEEGRRLLARFGWTFLLMNVVGFATYYVYPAAPPWYVADHGFGPADFSVRSSAAGAARWDALTGIPYFAGFYGRSADVFGAIPSLHVSYPLLTFLFGIELRRRWLDLASFALFALVSFAAVYLSHHYVLDVLLGVLYTVVAWGIDRWLQARRRAGAAGA